MSFSKRPKDTAGFKMGMVIRGCTGADNKQQIVPASSQVPIASMLFGFACE